MKFDKWSILPWITAVISILLLSLEIINHLPKLEPLSSQLDSFYEIKRNHYIPNCCLATMASNSSFTNAMVMAHSLNSIGIDPPTSYIFIKSDITEENRKLLEKYFKVIIMDANSKRLIYDELNFWTLDDCSVVVAVSSNGVFIKDMNHVCMAPPFSAVAKRGDVVSFDISMMVLNPKDKYPIRRLNDTRGKNFHEFINDVYPEWNILPSDLSVEDYKNDYLVFWSTYSRPTFIHYNPERFTNVTIDSTKSFGNKALSPLIKKAMKDAFEEYPNIKNINQKTQT